MRHDRLALPRCGARGELHALVGAPTPTLSPIRSVRVRLIVPALAGGPRTFQRALSPTDFRVVQQCFVVENRVGAGGWWRAIRRALRAQRLYAALPNTSVLAGNPALQGANMPYDPATAFAPIGFVSNSPQLLVAIRKCPTGRASSSPGLKATRASSTSPLPGRDAAAPHLRVFG